MIGPAQSGGDRSRVLNGLEALLRETHFAWSLDLIGEDQAGKLATLTGDLRRGVSTTGDGKRITSGFSYLGTEPAIAWANACRDRLYPVMKQSIDSFDRRWHGIREILGDEPYHYVSLGPGDGQKDEVILKDLGRDNPQLCYVAVDMSTEMLRLGVPALIRELQLSSRVLSVQLDFSSKDNVAELRHLLDVLFGKEAVLFSLLGNTMTNFENDTGCSGCWQSSCSVRRTGSSWRSRPRGSSMTHWLRKPPRSTGVAAPSASSSPARSCTIRT